MKSRMKLSNLGRCRIVATSSIRMCQSKFKKKNIELRVIVQEKQRGPLQAPYTPLLILESIDLRLIKCIQKYSNMPHFVRNLILYQAECLPIKSGVNVGNHKCNRRLAKIFYIFMSCRAQSDIISLSCSKF